MQNYKTFIIDGLRLTVGSDEVMRELIPFMEEGRWKIEYETEITPGHMYGLLFNIYKLPEGDWHGPLKVIDADAIAQMLVDMKWIQIHSGYQQ